MPITGHRIDEASRFSYTFTMRRILLFVTAWCCVGCGSTTARPAGETPRPAEDVRLRPVAVANLVDSSGAQVGLATLSDSVGSARLGLSVAGLTPGAHGLHIHAQGTCTPPSFASAGPHFNPDGKQHGTRNPQGPHAGDLPNLQIGANGSADTTFDVSADLARSGPRFLLQPGGTAIVIHAGPDDETTDPSGNSGARVACGVFNAP
jgi:Cu-Zn family superoxide dismutase